jgi:hypothetical protein
MQDAGLGLSLQDFTLTLGQCTADVDLSLALDDEVDPLLQAPDATALFTGTLGDLQLWDRVLPPDAVMAVAQVDENQKSAHTAEAHLLFGLSTGEYGRHLRLARVPAADLELHSHHSLHAKSLSGFSACVLPTPVPFELQAVAKPGSITVMAWVKLASLPEKKEACILSHGGWEYGWKLSL